MGEEKRINFGLNEPEIEESTSQLVEPSSKGLAEGID
jgi:hypothetical protein